MHHNEFPGAVMCNYEQQWITKCHNVLHRVLLISECFSGACRRFCRKESAFSFAA